MKSLLLKILMPWLKLTNGYPLKNKYSGQVQILMLHRVVDSIGKNRIQNDDIEVTTQYLEFLINFYLKNKFTPISINDFAKLDTTKNKKRYVVFSFDDGYYDNFEKALPIFQKYNIPFSVYITTDFIFRKQFAWWYFLEDIITNNTQLKYTNQNGQEIIVDTQTHAQKINCFATMRGAIQANVNILSQLISTHKPNINKYHNLFLNPQQLAQFAQHPLVTIGSHTLSHPSLAKCTDTQSHNEIYNSKTELENIIGKPVQHFSYPFGTLNDISPRDIQHVKQAGYITALTTNYGDIYTNKEINLHTLNRIWTGADIPERELYKSIYGINALITTTK